MTILPGEADVFNSRRQLSPPCWFLRTCCPPVWELYEVRHRLTLPYDPSGKVQLPHFTEEEPSAQRGVAGHRLIIVKSGNPRGLV